MEIFTNCSAHYERFIALNERWIREHFAIENTDMELARKPNTIFDAGGAILTAVVDKNIVGACALFRHDGVEYELARMVVEPSYQGQGIGRKIAEAAISTARGYGAKKMILLANTVLAPAVSLYTSLGFRVVREAQHPKYTRCNIVMAMGFESAI